MPETVEDLADDVLQLISDVAVALHDQRRSPTRPADVTALDAVLLQHISNGSTTLVDLCDRTGRLKGTISKRLARLTEVGLVDRAHMPGNRKTVALTLSPQGAAALAAHRYRIERTRRHQRKHLLRYGTAELECVRTILQHLHLGLAAESER
jgi:DNA-binding MarR family transcriptional regulator